MRRGGVQGVAWARAQAPRDSSSPNRPGSAARLSPADSLSSLPVPQRKIGKIEVRWPAIEICGQVCVRGKSFIYDRCDSIAFCVHLASAVPGGGPACDSRRTRARRPAVRPPESRYAQHRPRCDRDAVHPAPAEPQVSSRSSPHPSGIVLFEPARDPSGPRKTDASTSNTPCRPRRRDPACPCPQAPWTLAALGSPS